ncbi:MAG: protein translocase subunit SecF [Proteobacteria bacterium]|nr:protein translocase subunit SecF [Pseudomonadota bacterium]
MGAVVHHPADLHLCALRFHTIKLSTGAIFAALHDPLMVLGFFRLTWLPFDLSVIAAILAVIGYSLNDTVVVFDRIRERFEHNQRSSPEAVLDQSINQTLSRTVMTSGTTLLVVLVLFALGGPALEGFSIALVVGIVIGTYSSIYVASALALDLGLRVSICFRSRAKTPSTICPDRPVSGRLSELTRHRR